MIKGLIIQFWALRSWIESLYLFLCVALYIPFLPYFQLSIDPSIVNFQFFYASYYICLDFNCPSIRPSVIWLVRRLKNSTTFYSKQSVSTAVPLQGKAVNWRCHVSHDSLIIIGNTQRGGCDKYLLNFIFTVLSWAELTRWHCHTVKRINIGLSNVYRCLSVCSSFFYCLHDKFSVCSRNNRVTTKVLQMPLHR